MNEMMNAEGGRRSNQVDVLNWRVAHEWHTVTPLVYEGVNIGEAMTYDVLRIIGRQWQMAATAEGNPEAVPA
jgi:hypothetical protein